MNAVGTHLFMELRDCDEALLDDVRHIEDAMVGAAREAGGTVLARSFHKFEPRGVTGIVAIAESHLSIHTWPEHSYAAADVFTCGAAFRPHEAARFLVERLGCRRPSITEIKRGPLSEAAATAV